MAKYAAVGTEFRRSTDGFAANDTLIGQVRDISGPSLSADVADVTSHDSTNDWEEIRPTILRSGEVTLEVLFDPADSGHVALRQDLTSKAERDFKVVFPDTATTEWQFKGYVTAFAPAAPHDGELTASITIKLTGKPTLN